MVRMRGVVRFVAGLVVVALAGACAGGGGGGGASGPGGSAPLGSQPPGSGAPPGSVAPAAPYLALSPLHVEAGARPHFADAQGREVLLRGVNVNSYGDYFQADPALPATLPVTDEDWREMAALGFSAVRFIVTWSTLEPERGRYDEAYIDKVRDGIAAAGRAGLYVIVDMHQDAWSKYIATPPGTTCEADTETAIGWDGAPEWATLTDGASTCRSPGARELSPAVGTAFRNFYADKDGIRTALAQAWGHLAGRLADQPAVIGYDLLNEPNGVADLKILQPQYTAFLVDTITAIRKAEATGSVAPRIMFVEPIVLWPVPGTAPPIGFTDDENIAFAPHNYFGSISKLLTPEAGFEVSANYAQQLGAALWIGEYGWWGTDADSMAMLRRYAAAEDKAIAGSAWWQWRQACGDPHSLNNPERRTGDQLHLNGVTCPGDKDQGLTEGYVTVLSRPYPRAAPGTIMSLVSDPDARTMTMSGVAPAAGGELVVWVPDNGTGSPKAAASSVEGIEVHPVTGGFYVTGTARCAYQLSIGGPVKTAPLTGAC